MTPKRVFARAGLVACGLATRPAAAEAPLSIEWIAPPGCPTSEAVRARVDGLLGAPAESLLQRPLGARGTVASDGARSTLRLETNDGEVRGERALEGASCDEVTNAGALILALAVDPKAVEAHASTVAGARATGDPVPAEPPAPAPAPTSTVPVGPAPAPAPPPPPPPPPGSAEPPESEPGPPLRGFFDVEGLIDVGTLPGIAPGFGFALGLGAGRLRGVASGAYFPNERGEDPQAPGKGAEIARTSGNLVGSYAFVPGSVELWGSLGFEGGTLSPQPYQLANGTKDPESKRWLAVLGGVELDVLRFAPLLLRLHIAAIAPISPSKFIYSDDDGTHTAHEPSPVGGRFGLGIGLAFP